MYERSEERDEQLFHHCNSHWDLKCLLTGAKATWHQSISGTLVHAIAVDMQMIQQMKKL